MQIALRFSGELPVKRDRQQLSENPIYGNVEVGFFFSLRDQAGCDVVFGEKNDF
jgi:hypothetical protein